MIGKRLCWNCEGEVHTQAVRCPFCGADLSSQQSEQVNPPYSANYDIEDEQSQVPEPPYSNAEFVKESTDEEWEDAVSEAGKNVLSDNLPKDLSVLAPLSLLSLGGVFFLFSLVLLIFSKDGFLTLQWRSSHWPIYMVLSVLGLFFGWRALDKNHDEEIDT